MRNVLLLFVLLALAACNREKSSFRVPFSDSVYFEVHPNATFDLVANEISITGMIPSINGNPITFKRFSVERDDHQSSLHYHLFGGEVLSLILTTDSSGLQLITEFKGSSNAPAYISPIANGSVTGADRFFKQGIGFAGPSGVFSIPKPPVRVDKQGTFEEVWSYDSYVCFGLFAPDQSSLAMGSYDNTNFLQRTVFFNRQHRFGLIDRWLESNRLFADIGFSTEEITLPGKKLVLPALHFIPGSDPFTCMQHFAKNTATFNRVKLNQKPSYHYCSWYEMGNRLHENHVFEMIRKIKDLPVDPEIQTVQIDEGYAVRGDWLTPTEYFPSGLDTLFARIAAAGYRPGAWVGPFMVSGRSQLHKTHPEWLLHDLSGELHIEGISNSDTAYVIDSSNPEAFQYLRRVFSELRRMGVRFYKTDFMDWGLRNSMNYKRFTPGKTSVQYFREVAEMIREEIGEDSYWLGCISPYGPLIGLVDGMRIANDLPESWNPFSQPNMYQESQACQYFNRIYWENDPDVLYLDGFITQYSEKEKESILLWNGMLGGSVNTSDRFHLVSDKYMKWWKFVKPDTRIQPAVFPYWDKPFPFRVMTRSVDSGFLQILIANDTGKKLIDTLRISDITDQSEMHVFQWLPGKSIPLGKMPFIQISLEPHESRLFYFSPDGTEITPESGIWNMIPLND